MFPRQLGWFMARDAYGYPAEICHELAMPMDGKLSIFKPKYVILLVYLAHHIPMVGGMPPTLNTPIGWFQMFHKLWSMGECLILGERHCASFLASKSHDIITMVFSSSDPRIRIFIAVWDKVSLAMLSNMYFRFPWSWS
jgi:hypothetical protein